MILDILRVLFGGGKNVVRDVAEVFTPNAEKQAVRAADFDSAVAAQFAAEFIVPRRTLFDAFVDGLNRLPRPIMTFGVIGLFVYAVNDPAGFTDIAVALSQVPDPMWAVLGLVVTFFFGGRYQTKWLEKWESTQYAFRKHVNEAGGRDPVADWESENGG